MKFKNDLPDNYEWILRKSNNIFKKLKKQTVYKFECWDEFAVHDTIARFKTKTAKQMADKIKKFVIRINKKK